MSKDKLAKDLADEIFDMIDRNYPRGLIKSDLADLIGKHMTSWQIKHDLINPDVFPPPPCLPADLAPSVDLSPGAVNSRTWTNNKPEINICGND